MATCRVARMPRRELAIRTKFAPTRSSSLQLECVYEMVMPQVEYVAIESRELRTNREQELRSKQGDRR